MGLGTLGHSGIWTLADAGAFEAPVAIHNIIAMAVFVVFVAAVSRACFSNNSNNTNNNDNIISNCCCYYYKTKTITITTATTATTAAAATNKQTNKPAGNKKPDP